MEILNLIQLLLALLAARVALTILANRLSIPAPLILVPAGVILGFIPWFPRFELNPDVVLSIFLPPLIYTGSVSAWNAVQKNIRPIFLLSFGLVLFTMAFVALAAHHLIPGITWPIAFVLGAIIAPTDDVAAGTVVRKLSVPHRLVSVLEGEGLLNDATALTAFQFAVAAVVSGSFHLERAIFAFFAMVVGEVAYGLLLGWVVSKVRQKLKDPSLELTVSFLTPFLAYLIPERLGGSGVLATAIAGLYIGSQSAKVFTLGVRLIGVPMWQLLVFIFNNFLFLVTGLQLRFVLGEVSDYSPATLLYYGAVVSGVVILSRLVWVYPAAFLPRAFSASLRARDPMPPFRHIFILSWIGMRGAISLAAAFGIPAMTGSGSPFPYRGLIIFIAFCVILSTLVLQGITLPPLIRWLGIDRDGEQERKGAHYQETLARLEAAKAALQEIDTWEKEGVCSTEIAEHLRHLYEKQIRKLDRHRDEESDDAFGHLSKKETELQLKVLDTERNKILELYDQGVIADDVLRLIVLDLDLQEMRLRQNAHLDPDSPLKRNAQRLGAANQPLRRSKEGPAEKGNGK